MTVCPELELIENFYDAEDRSRFLAYFLRRHPWPDNRYTFGGRQFVLPRLQTWHADAGIRYSYSNNLLVTRPWTASLLAIRAEVESRLAYRFNSVLVNFYRDGDDFVGWHADNEPELGESPLIASLSFGAARPLAFRHKISGETGRLVLPTGSLLLMRPAFQSQWQHSVPQDRGISAARINLTFRKVCQPTDRVNV
ncbi:alpha-ketoglutarate-dependent dioxygenase AlkB family protein [Methylomonas rivi]|uniref:Alpha-ketoglutarate-dependent dioxygenase AlkB n=1 Tax=Methylomonas rivi TaxID=2952226 RepID=A0ABT1U1D4_9GAMM|nr:alpha-ketoglutarate-dependent dioxygenase AlkB [Methylomonas sp. WSC-6]MCQ8127633.1 alpha-ketoglutarate-dependent dioxygenase AlkB [Methylomonas sp. WSC-6]